MDIYLTVFPNSFLPCLKGGHSDFLVLDFQLFPGLFFFFHASLFPRLSDGAVMMAGVGNAFLLAMIELVAQKRRNEP